MTPLRSPGPARSQLLAVVAAELKMATGLCGDRARITAGRILDRTLDALERGHEG